jgi:hypothetical protein
VLMSSFLLWVDNYFASNLNCTRQSATNIAT